MNTREAIDAILAYAKDGNVQAVENAQADLRTAGWELDAMRWSGKSHAYTDVIAFIEYEILPELGRK